jgi:4a-hydroxytetrahydrobiopterin dehydratase
MSQPAKPVSDAPSSWWTGSSGVGRGAPEPAGVLAAPGGLGGDPGTSEWYAGPMELLTDDQITVELSETPGWTLAGSEISRTVERHDFKDAMIFVGGVAFLAEEANHHPDILVQWNKVTLTLSTHSAGGLTAADFSMARLISGLA